MENDACLAGAGRAHVDKFALARRNLFDDDTCELIIHVNGGFFDGFEAIAFFIFAIKHAGTRNAELEAFAAHLLDEHAKLQFATARDVESVTDFSVADADGNVAFGFAHQAVADDARLNLGAFAACKRAVIDRDGD